MKKYLVFILPAFLYLLAQRILTTFIMSDVVTLMLLPITLICYFIFTKKRKVQNYLLMIAIIIAAFAPLYHYTSLKIIVLMFAGPICEEIVFRELVYNKNKDEVGSTFAIVFSSLLFAFAHAINPIMIILSFAVGVILCLSYKYSKHFTVPVVLHIALNLAVFLITKDAEPIVL